MVSSRAWFALAVAGVLGLFCLCYGLQCEPAGVAYGQAVPIQPLFTKPSTAKPSLKFRYVGSNGNTEIYRAKVPGGWLISATDNSSRNGGLSVAFVPDPEHRWDGNSLP